VELSLTEAYEPEAQAPVEPSLDRWSAVVGDAGEACLVINLDTEIVAMSTSCRQMLGLDESAVGKGLLDGGLHLLDFADGGALTDVEVSKIPPLLALSGQLARGLLRVVCASGATPTLDAIATPLFDDSEVVGSLTFFSQISGH
jgi:PAS domain-containing protein